uniref:Auxin-responsive protein n=1 Tax=Picea sitchensis TaxID=3332 RepID=B8LKX2_PICSI|nr:unknown [Picea sitchensis]
MGSLREHDDEQSLKETELKLGLPGVTEGSEHRTGKRTFSEAFMESGNDEKWVVSSSVKSVTAFETSKPNEQGMLATPLAQKMMQRSFPPLSWKAGIQTDPSGVAVSAEEKQLGNSANDSEMPPPKAQAIGWPPVRSFRRNTLAFNSKTTEEGSSNSSDLYAKATQSQTTPDTTMASAPATAPVPKAQVVGWPPVRSFRKNTLVANSTPTENGPSGNAMYVKVSMDGAPYLRKVDLKMYSTYHDLSSALEKMFSCFSMGKCGSHGLNENKLMDLLNGSEYVPTYEDKDGDWMLVGDVPWEMFVDFCKRMRIMKVSEAIGLAPRAMEKRKNRI